MNALEKLQWHLDERLPTPSPNSPLKFKLQQIRDKSLPPNLINVSMTHNASFQQVLWNSIQ